MTTIDFSGLEFEKLDRFDTPEYVDTRLQLHYAIQIIAAIGYTFRIPRPDWGHVSLKWNEPLRALVNPADASPGAINAGLRISDLTLLLLGVDQQIVSSFPLTGRTLQEGYGWLTTKIEESGGPGKSLIRPDHELPFHSVADGMAFKPDPATLYTLASLYANASTTLERIHGPMASASPIRCWPHHFDIATLVQFDQGEDPEEARSIGIGFSPGDQNHQEPYWYILPWPAPQVERLPEFGAVGEWNTAGWVGAILENDRLTGYTNPALPIAEFLNFGILASLDVLTIDSRSIS